MDESLLLEGRKEMNPKTKALQEKGEKEKRVLHTTGNKTHYLSKTFLPVSKGN